MCFTNHNHRDQELRFTVHESPDYYKLRCSVFNEDKKNDLIGEGWIDLKEVVKPGGGQNDLWHPLHFKGKYAGDVRIELTYYDSRPKDEAGLERKREKERNDAGAAGNPGAGGTRHAGPREIKRRPLPPDPMGSSPAIKTPAVDNVHSSPMPVLNNIQSYSALAPSYDDSVNDYSYPDTAHYSTPDHTRPHANEHYDQRQFADEYRQSSPHEYFTPQDQYYPHSSHRDEFEQGEDLLRNNAQSFQPNQYNFQSSPVTQSPYQRPGGDERRHSAQPSFPVRDVLPSAPSSSYASSPPAHSSPGVIRSAPGSGDHRHRAQLNRFSTSPIKSDLYRDSPLRQSISHHEVDPEYDDLQGNLEDQPAPPPPAHRNSLPQCTPPTSSYQDMLPIQVPRNPQVSSPKHFSPDSRSPLQAIERNFDTYLHSPSSPVSPSTGRQNNYPPYQKPAYPPGGVDFRNRSYPRPHSGRENTPPDFRNSHENLRGSVEGHLSYEDHEVHRLTSRPMPVSGDRVSYGFGRPEDQQNLSGMHDEQRPYRSHPPVLKPRAVSPDARITPTRKSVSPQPIPAQEEQRLSGVPFGPDSYDVLNPTSVSATVDGPTTRYENVDQAKEAARLREVEKLREQGPIIGNDGRVIDPSDHLPTDTWAPEPERKNRKPEHVIRFKTKDIASRTQDRLGSSPDIRRPQSMPIPMYGSSPLSADSPSSRPIQAIGGRNRLQKQMQSRPLPAQPFQHAQSSPAVPMAPQISAQSTPSPRSRGPPRPPLSDYSVMANQGYGNSTYSQGFESSPPPIPAKVPMHSGVDGFGYGRQGGMDALSAEMSTIDIGVASGGRRGVRTSRGYQN